MAENIKTDVDKLFLVLKMENKFPIYFAKIEIVFNFEFKKSLSTSIFIFFTISQIKKKNFLYFKQKHVEI